jgi:hypothetical protein
MPVEIKDDTPAELAQLKGLTKQDAVRLTAQAGLESAQEAIPLRARVQALRAAHPLPPLTGKTADKDLFDDLSGAV